TNGVELQILEQRDKWCRVRQSDGYEGWTYKPYLVDVRPIEPTHITHLTVTVFAQPEPGPSVSRFPIGTSLHVVETHDRWSRVRACAGNMIPEGWVDSLFLRELSCFPLNPKDARREIVSVARGLTGTHYLWGGCTDWGI